MYRSEHPALAGASVSRVPRDSARISGTVFALGTVSLLTDISSEMVAAILPIYLTTTVGLSPLGFGITDGLYQGVTLLVRLLGGWWSDRAGRSKFVCLVGYGVSAVAKPLYLVAQGLAGISAVVAVDRAGKGIRSAPRDAMIVAAEPRDRLGRAFGVHRAMDTVGAMAGPVTAFWMLSVVPRGYRPIFIVSGLIALIGVAALWTFVPSDASRGRLGRPKPARQVSRRWATARSKPLRRLVLVAAVLSLMTVSDGFVYLVLQTRSDMDTRLFPLLFLGTALAYFALSIPVGMLADRLGRWRVYVVGHVMLVAVYALLLNAAGAGTAFVLAVLALLGAYYACTDGVLAALAGGLAPPGEHGRAIGAAQTAVAGGRLGSSLVFGLLWPGRSDSTGLVCFAVGMTTALVLAAAVLPKVAAAGQTAPSEQGAP